MNDQRIETKTNETAQMEDFIKVAQASGDVTSRIAAIALWNAKSAEDRTAYVEQRSAAVTNKEAQLTQEHLSTYKTKVDALYSKLSGLMLNNDAAQQPSTAELRPYLRLPEKAAYWGRAAADLAGRIAGKRTERAKGFLEGMRKTVTFRRIDEIVQEYQEAIDENAAELAKAREKEAQLEQEKNECYENILRLGDEFDGCEKYLFATKKQVELEREKHRDNGMSVQKDISTCMSKDIAPTQKRADTLAGTIKRAYVSLQHKKRNSASMRMATYVLDQLDTRLHFDQAFLRDFKVNNADVVNIDVPLRGLNLVRAYAGFAPGMAALGAEQDDANLELAKLHIGPGYTFGAEEARTEELAGQLEHINGEVRSNVRDIIDKVRHEVFG